MAFEDMSSIKLLVRALLMLCGETRVGGRKVIAGWEFYVLPASDFYRYAPRTTAIP